MEFDIMTQLHAFYRVTINNVGLLSTDPSNGFIDPRYPWSIDFNGVYADTNLLSYAKTRGNERWKNIVQQIELRTTPRFVNIDVTGGDQNTAPTSMSFTLDFDRPEVIFDENPEQLPSAAPLTGIAAITRWIARALIMDRTNNVQVYKPETASKFNIVQGISTMILEIGQLCNTIADANAVITVTQIPNVS